MRSRIAPRLAVVALVCALLAVSGLSACSAKKAADAPAATGGSGLDGKAVIAQKCTACHTAEQADHPVGNKTAAEFIVSDMINKGAELTPAEKQAVIDYLSQ